MKSYWAKKEGMERKWYLIDAENMRVGRLAAEVAKILRGKNKPTFTPNVDCGDHVVVINASKMVLSGNKAMEPVYWHTQYPGGIRSRTRGDILAKDPQKSLMRAVKGMLPHNKLGNAMLKKLRVYAGSEHEQEAQKPEPIKID